MKYFKRIYKQICMGAFVINVGLFIFAHKMDFYDLEVLSILNMIFLSFTMLLDTNKA
jgi:hypothetical protein